jgi:DNA-binding MarR family transcriptional regulator
MAATPTPATSPCPTADAAALRKAPAEREAAWLGLLQVHADLTRGLDAELVSEVGLSLSAVDVLTRVAFSEGGMLRVSEIANATLLSQSRISRLAAELERRGLLERRPCPGDSRVVNVAITDAGRTLLSRALDVYWDGVDRQLLDRLTESQIEELGRIWAKALGPRAEGCPT